MNEHLPWAQAAPFKHAVTAAQRQQWHPHVSLCVAKSLGLAWLWAPQCPLTSPHPTPGTCNAHPSLRRQNQGASTAVSPATGLEVKRREDASGPQGVHTTFHCRTDHINCVWSSGPHSEVSW